MIDTSATRRVRDCLTEAGLTDRTLELSETSRSASEAAAAIGVAVGAIVKTLIFTITAGDSGEVVPVVALVSGDMRCDVNALSSLAGIDGHASRPDADYVKKITGYSIGAVSPVGLEHGLVVLIDQNLGRFERIWASAGHTHLVMGVSLAELQALTSGRITDGLVMAEG